MKKNINFCLCVATVKSKGINLILVRFYRKSSKYNLELSTDLKEIITGLMLGDLFAEKIKPNSNTRLQFKQSIKNKIYIDYLYNILLGENSDTVRLDPSVHWRNST